VKYHILIVDDEAIVRKGLENYEWAPLGFEVIHSCENGRKALSWLQNHQVDMVVTDIKMPGIDGIELSKKIKELFPDILVVLLSGYSEFSYAQQGIQHGVFDYLLKPVDDEQFEAVLKRAYKQINQKEKKQNSMNELMWNMWLRMQIHYCNESGGVLKPFSDTCYINIEHPFQIANVIYTPASVLEKTSWREFTNTWKMVQLNHSEWVGLVFTDQSKDMRAALKAFSAHSGFSSTKTGENDIAKAYIEARTAAQKKFLYPDERVFESSQQIQETSYKDFSDLFKKIYVLANKTNHLNANEIKKDLIEYTDELLRMETPTFQIKQLFLHLVSGMERVLSEKALFSFTEWLDEQPDLYQLIEEAPSFSTIYEQVIPEICRMIEKVKNLNENHNLSKKFLKILDYIHEHYQDPLSLNELSEYFGMHPSLFSKWFKEQKGMNYIDYLTRYRLYQAKELIEHTDLKISEISSKVGYYDMRYFGQVFKKNTGLKPTEYRAMIHK
jgi:two-component system response regulator YesN